MKRGKNSLYLFNQAAKNSNEMTHLSGVLVDDYRDFPADTKVDLGILASGKLTVREVKEKIVLEDGTEEEPDRDCYWTTPVKDVHLEKGYVEIRTQNSIIRVKSDDFIHSLNFSKYLMAILLDKKRRLA